MPARPYTAICSDFGHLMFSTPYEKPKWEIELQIAADMQRAMLPQKLPQVPGYEFWATYEWGEFGGRNYYDCLLLPRDRVAIAFANIAGRGVPASLTLMARLTSVVQVALEFVDDLGDAGRRINEHICAHVGRSASFATLALASINLKTHEIALISAGQMSPMIRRTDGTVDQFSGEMFGLPLGIDAGIKYNVHRRTLQPGETIVFHSDGVICAMNPESDHYGADRLREMLVKNRPEPTTLGQAILADVKRHARGRERKSEITLLVFGRTAND